MPRETPSIERIRQNPTLYPLAFDVVSECFTDLKWHSHADSPDSSQAFALSAFVPLLRFEDRNEILERFVTSAFPAIPSRADRSWHVTPEYTNRDLLGETGAGMPTNVDILLVADDVVVCVESKFRVDALEGFGKCGQATSGDCAGFHGTGSDAKCGGDASCRLTAQDGRRNPRRYWESAQGQFRDEVFAEQSPSQVCPLRDTYQLMRNYLTASELARRCGKPYFGVVGIVPKARASALTEGVRQFRDEVLLPENADRVSAVDYEDYIAVLDSGTADARALAVFLSQILRHA